jgi:hypothetical protein
LTPAGAPGRHLPPAFRGDARQLQSPQHHPRASFDPLRPAPALRFLRRTRQPRGEDTMTIKIVPNDKGNPPGKLAEAELHFTHGPLEGLKLIGFAVWERKTGNGRNVTFPGQYSVNGERRSYSLLRPIGDVTAQDRLRDLILQAYAEYEAQAAVAS